MQQAQDLSSDTQKSIDIPSDLICPLTLEVFTDPLATKYGHNFEREAILEWLATHNQVCPLTRKPLSPSMLFPNAKLRLKIRSWQQDNAFEVSCPGLECGDSVVVGEKLVFSAQDMDQHRKDKPVVESRSQSGVVSGRRRQRTLLSILPRREVRIFGGAIAM
ncbi:MAG: hypothetical protein SGILL_008559 [Bacillariaceae sp.]